MSDTPTHRYVGPKPLRRAAGPDYHPGDRCSPSDAEVSAFSDSFEEIEVVSEADVEAEVEEEAAGLVDEIEREVLEENGIDPDDYSAMRSEASEFDDVNGRAPKDELRSALADALAAEEAYELADEIENGE